MEEATRKIGRHLGFFCFICLSLGKRGKDRNNENVNNQISKSYRELLCNRHCDKCFMYIILFSVPGASPALHKQ